MLGGHGDGDDAAAAVVVVVVAGGGDAQQEDLTLRSGSVPKQLPLPPRPH